MNWSPASPQLAGSFKGKLMHSFQYKESIVLHGQRVLVVGAGPSGTSSLRVSLGIPLRILVLNHSG